jgi:hypothetical protein
MAERKKLSSILAGVKPAAKKVSSFDALMAVSPLDAEPNLAEIVRQVSDRSTEVVDRNSPPEEYTDSGGRNHTPYETVHRKSTPKSDADTVHRKHQPKQSTGQVHRKDINAYSSPSAKLLPNQALIKTEKQRKLLAFLEANPVITTTHAYLSDILGQRKNTIRDNLNLFLKHGLIEKEVVQIPGRGVVLEIRFWSTETVHRNGPLYRSTEMVHRTPPLKIDREKTLSISQERISMTWPKLAAAGFGADQVEQIGRALAELGKPTDRIVQSLDHAEWELENGKMMDKEGKPVADPCSWVFRSLARTGYYRRPAGYVSAEEQAIRDAEVEVKAQAQARQKAEISRFEAWRDSLSAAALHDALKGHPGGPKDAWLRKVWKERHEGRE